jgi:hypothetical protein
MQPFLEDGLQTVELNRAGSCNDRESSNRSLQLQVSLQPRVLTLYVPITPLPIIRSKETSCRFLVLSHPD